MNKDRPAFNLDIDEEDIDISQLSNTRKSKPQPKPKTDDSVLKKTAEASGFVSRQPRSRKRSTFTEQMNFKCRPGMKELIQGVGEALDVRDYDTLERAVLALIEKEKLSEQAKRFREITNSTR